ncbi:hypothetical protein PIB30_016130 [Stylosanthes scabra]|uniref:Uncharacterized protein n=1 Tax=Stylosanthes scabra TaxID=79078 RepID=A0ABU6S756_9FABA|nr:hypothetical protein [Stylosanthes scabra]
MEQEAVGEACLASNLSRHSASESGSCTCLSKLSSSRRPPATVFTRWTPRSAPSPRRRPPQQLPFEQGNLLYGQAVGRGRVPMAVGNNSRYKEAML